MPRLWNAAQPPAQPADRRPGELRGLRSRFVKLQRDLRDKPELAKLGRELYPELGDHSWITPEERVALHVHEEILQLVENAWLRLRRVRRPDIDINRGWMNTLRRLTSTPSFRRFRPLLRAQYNPDFQIFCERSWLDADDPRRVELVPSTTEPSPGAPYAKMLDGQILSTAKQVQDVAAEFAREWPDFVYEDLGRIRCRGCDLRLMSADDVSGIPTADKSLIIMADVKEVLHFRAFDSKGKVVVDTDEKQLKEQAKQIKVLRKQHENLFATLTPMSPTTWAPTHCNGCPR